MALARHEHYLAHAMRLEPGMRVLDVGCGVGGSAREIAAFTACHITGLNINQVQVTKGRELIKKDGMEDMVNLVQGDFMVSALMCWCGVRQTDIVCSACHSTRTNLMQCMR
jgi:sterol 24-C-methyltransferase